MAGNIIQISVEHMLHVFEFLIDNIDYFATTHTNTHIHTGTVMLSAEGSNGRTSTLASV
jgi:hypothetical protein